MTDDPLVLLVDVTSPVPPYEQIRGQVAAHVATGRLGPGARLPTLRALAADLGVATGTVARAYRELEATGVVVARRRTGTVVADGMARPATAGAAAADVLGAARVLVRRGREAGWSDDDLLSAVRGVLLGPA